MTPLGLSASLLMVHASEYEQKPIAVTKGANKFLSLQDHIVLAAHNMRDRRSRTVASSERLCPGPTSEPSRIKPRALLEHHRNGSRPCDQSFVLACNE